jgi:hypothetical protein
MPFRQLINTIIHSLMLPKFRWGCHPLLKYSHLDFEVYD